MKSILSLLLTVTIIVFGAVAGADTTISQVTSDSYKDSLPRIKGDYLVWQGYVGGHWEIFLYDTATEETTQITDNDYDDVSPQTDGDYIVWHGFKDGEWDVFLWNGSKIQAISDRSAEDLSPQIANGVIVWTSQPFGDDFVGHSEIVLYDAGTQTSAVLSEDVDPTNTLDDSGPKVSDEAVIWVQSDDQDNTTVYMYDLSNGTITENPDYVWRDSPHRHGNLSVLTRHDGQDREIFVYNSESRKYHQVTDNSLQDRYPSISGNYIAWMAGEEIFLAEYKYLALSSPTESAILSRTPPPTFTWEGIGYDKFNVEFSEDPDFLTGNVLTLAVGEETWLSETSLTPTETDWVAIRTIEQGNGRAYWRVEGKGSDGSVSYSETRSFTIYQDGETGMDTPTGHTGGDTDTSEDGETGTDTYTENSGADTPTDHTDGDTNTSEDGETGTDTSTENTGTDTPTGHTAGDANISEHGETGMDNTTENTATDTSAGYTSEDTTTSDSDGGGGGCFIATAAFGL